MKRRKFIALTGSASVAAASTPLLARAVNSEKEMAGRRKLRVSYVGFFHETNTYLTEGLEKEWQASLKASQCAQNHVQAWAN